MAANKETQQQRNRQYSVSKKSAVSFAYESRLLLRFADHRVPGRTERDVKPSKNPVKFPKNAIKPNIT